jgi:hypothetical protein
MRSLWNASGPGHAQRVLPVALFLLITFLAAPRSASATTYTWQGPSGANWNVPANWSPSTGFPNSTSDTAADDVGGAVPELRTESFGARIEVTNGVPIAVERSLYWDANGVVFWAGGTNALATPLPVP